MEDPFKIKVEDFVRWCETAFAHYRNEYYADSLTNMRKSGEAACKLMVYYKYSEKRAENKIGNKGYKELIELVIKDDLAPRMVINWLEALQIHGNIATHDNRVIREQAQYSITALGMLTNWMFNELFKLNIPSELKKTITQVSEKPEADNTTEKFEEELNRVKNDKEELEKQLKALKGKDEQEKENISKLNKELEKAALKITELEAAQQKINFLEKELLQMKTEADELKQKQTEIILYKKHKNLFSRKAVLTFLLSFAVIFIMWLFYKNFYIKSNKTTDIESIHDSVQSSDSIRVMVLPLNILQDNPNIKIKFEEAFINRIKQKIQTQKLRLDIFYQSSFNTSVLSVEDAIKEGLKEKAGLVIFGEIYEPLQSDSTRVNIKYSLTRENNKNTGETGIKSFLNLSDSSAIKIQQEIECYIDFALADNFMNRSKYSDALELLYNTVPINKYQKETLYDLLASCHFYLKNYSAAIIELEKYIKFVPDSSYPYAFMGNVLKQKGDFTEAEKYYKKALSIKPNDVQIILNYADMIAINGTSIYNSELSKELVLSALKFDSTNSIALQYMADIEYSDKNYKEAKKFYSKCTKIDAGNLWAKKQLAEVLAFYFDEPEKAVEYCSEILKKDFTFVYAWYLLGNIYTSTRLQDTLKSEICFAMSKKYAPVESEGSISYGMGLNEFNKNNFKKAIAFFLKAYSADSSDLSLCHYISQSFLQLKDYDKALLFMEREFSIDSMNYIVNFNLGYFYCYTDEKYSNYDKASYYFERVLKTNPYDTLSLQYLAQIYYFQQKIEKTKEVCTKLYSISPDNYYVNKFRGYLAETDLDYPLAIEYYKKALAVFPDDDETNARIAVVMMKLSGDKYVKEALNYAKRSVELNPEYADNLYIYSQALFYTGDLKSASEYYYKALDIKPSVKNAYMENAFK
ncbi:MAG: tetratricopeptide repeat protein [Bacteroidota bacterium]